MATGNITPASNVVYTESHVYGHYYGPFQNSRFHDPIRLNRKANDFFDPHPDDHFNPAIKRSRYSESHTDDAPDTALNAYLASTYETTQMHQSKQLPSTLNSFVPYPSVSVLPALQDIEIDYAPSRVDDSQPLPLDSKQHKVLLSCHYLQKSLNSHVQCDLFDISHDTLSTDYDNLAFEHFFALLTCDQIDEPRSYAEAITSPYAKDWTLAMTDELQAIEENQTWTLISRSQVPPGSQIINSTWVYKIKHLPDASLKFCARLCSRGDRDSNISDISETYTPVPDQNEIRTVLSYANKYHMVMRQLDIKSAFLHGDLEHPVYMAIPQGSSINPALRKTHVYKLFHSLYGLKVAPKRWFEKFRAVLLKLGFKPLVFKPCIYKWKYTNKNNVSKQVILIVYVDDILLIGDSNDKILNVVKKLQDHFKITDLGTPQNFLGIEFVRIPSPYQLFLHQRKYTEKILKRFNFDTQNTPHTSTPMITLDAQKKHLQSEFLKPPDSTLSEKLSVH